MAAGELALEALALEALGVASSERWDEEACAALAKEWPVAGVAQRLARMRQGEGAASFGLVDRASGRCVGHAALQEAADTGDGRSGVVTSVVVAHDLRGRGLGRVLMDLLEARARERGLTYLYLWTSTAAAFYARCGYVRCERVNLSLPILQRLDESAVASLESMLAARLQRVAASGGAAAAGAAQEGPDEQGVEWMRKRLVERLPAEWRPAEETEAAVAEACRAADATTGWGFAVREAPWERQVGPSCGLAALRMARGALLGDANADGLLAAAQGRGYSVDGEVFDVDHLCALAGVAGLSARVEKLPSAPSESGAALSRLAASGALLLLPYDRGLGDSRPSQAGGQRAHYCLIFGLAWPLASAAAGTAAPASPPASPGAAALLVAQHGMGRRLLVAPSLTWAASNAQLGSAASRFGRVRLNLAFRVLVVSQKN